MIAARSRLYSNVTKRSSELVSEPSEGSITSLAVCHLRLGALSKDLSKISKPASSEGGVVGLGGITTNKRS